MTKRYLDDPDVQCMLRIREGDAVAFEEMVSRYAPILVNFMRRFVGTDSIAEDLAQEVFMKVHRAAPGYEPTARFKTWILTIATASRFLGEGARAFTDHPALGWIVVAGGLGQIGGLALYFWTMWSRIRPVGSHIREARGERF